jgi:hypothetical protein
VTLSRVYFTCRRCGTHAHALDDRLGVDGLVSLHAQRLLCWVGAEWSFERCSRYLKDIAGMLVCDNTVRKVCHWHGGQMRTWQRENPRASVAFRAADGDVEFQTDGAAVNTTKGWREIRLSIFAKRHRGKPVTDLDSWDKQRLPAPHARVATAVIRKSGALGPSWRRAASRLGISRTAEITVLADGAKWIWKEVDRHLPGAAGVLDIYHASEHVYQTAAALYGEATPASQDWAERKRRTLLEAGADGLLADLSNESGDVSGLMGYLEPHRAHAAYRERLARGQSIGSGMVEGACKTAIGHRLKQTGARWRIGHLEHMAALCCLHYSNQFDDYWRKEAG